MPAPPLPLLRTQSDDRLVALARAGHERAFEAIVQRYRRPLLRACRRYLPEARAEDALQQALLAAWTALSRGDEVRELRPWLYRIAHNTALNSVRQSGYDHEQLADSLRAAYAPEEELERRAIVRQTLAGVAALPERQREALLRMALEGAAADEVARDLGLSTGAVRQLVHRARATLRTAATALTPWPLAAWAAGAHGGDGIAQRIAELCAPAAVGAASVTAAKVGAVAVLAGGAVAGPVAVRDDGGRESARAAAAASAQEARADRDPGARGRRAPGVAGRRGDRRRREQWSRPGRQSRRGRGRRRRVAAGARARRRPRRLQRAGIRSGRRGRGPRARSRPWARPRRRGRRLRLGAVRLERVRLGRLGAVRLERLGRVRLERLGAVGLERVRLGGLGRLRGLGLGWLGAVRLGRRWVRRLGLGGLGVRRLAARRRRVRIGELGLRRRPRHDTARRRHGLGLRRVRIGLGRLRRRRDAHGIARIGRLITDAA